MTNESKKPIDKLVHETVKSVNISVFENSGNGNSYQIQVGYKDREGNWRNKSLSLFGREILPVYELLGELIKRRQIKLTPITRFVVTEQSKPGKKDPGYQSTSSEKENPFHQSLDALVFQEEKPNKYNQNLGSKDPFNINLKTYHKDYTPVTSTVYPIELVRDSPTNYQDG